MAHNAKTNCHGMEAPANVPFSVTTEPQTCNLTAATVATLAKPVIEARISFRTLNSIRFLDVAVNSKTAASAPVNSLLRSQDSPPHLLVFSVAPAILRI